MGLLWRKLLACIWTNRLTEVAQSGGGPRPTQLSGAQAHRHRAPSIACFSDAECNPGVHAGLAGRGDSFRAEVAD